MRRKLLYGGVASILAAVVLMWAGFSVFSRPASCFDNKKNQGETGVDCGGPCARICENQARPPVVVWTRALETQPGVYTAVAYVENPNAAENAAAYGVHYAFRLLDSNNLLVSERDGVIDLPPQQNIPIIEPNISVGTRSVARAFLEFSDASISWTKVSSANISSVQVIGQDLSPDGSRLSASVINRGTSNVKGLTLAAILYDGTDTAQAASRSVLDAVAPSGSQAVTFTWPGGIPNIVRAEIVPLPALPQQ